MKRLVLSVLWLAVALQASGASASSPFRNGKFQGRIAYSADGNNRDRDDLFASAVTIAMFKAFGVTDRVVHFDYNSILGEDNPDYLKVHEESVRGAARRFGLSDRVIFNDSTQLEASVNNIRDAVNASSADDPLYFVIAGPMEVPWRGINAAEPAKRKHVYCISHTVWNDLFFWDTGNRELTHHRRDLIDLGVNWVQILNQQGLGTCPEPKNGPCPQEKWALWEWMRDSRDSNVAWLFERLEAMGRPDCSDSGMVYFLLTGNERASVQDLNDLLHGRVPKPLAQRPNVRLEAENFQLENFTVPPRRLGNALSQRMAAQLERGKREGTIRTVFHQPYAGDGLYDIGVHYLAPPQGTSKLRLLINGAAQGEPQIVPALHQGIWAFRDVTLKQGDELALKVVIDGDQTGNLDYVQLNWRDNQTSPTAVQARGGPSQLDNPAALPGQIIVAGGKPGYLKYNGGGPVFLCGPDNPEEFLFLGTLNADGTRSGGKQEQLIESMAAAGVNVMHCQMFRMRRCNIKDEGDDQHCPFIDFDPARPLNEKVLDQWEGWLKKLEERGINVHFEFYNDATDVERMGWKLDAAGNLHPDEERFFRGIVGRFKHLKNIIWGIEESLNKLPRERTAHFKKLSALVAEVDNHDHPIVHSFVTPETSEKDFGRDNITSDEYRDDPHIDITSWLHVLPHGTDYEAQHQAYLKYAAIDRDRFIVMKGETEKFPRQREQSRRYLWSCALTGMHTPEAGVNALTRPALLPDAGRVRKFMEQTDFHTMRPHDELAAGSTKWVLANPGQSYIAYTYDCSGPMGIKDLIAGEYNLTWFDTVSGRSVTQANLPVPAGAANWNKPAPLGNEIALYVRRSNQGARPAAKKLRVALIQMALAPTLDGNRDRIIRGVADAASQGARVAVFPERALTGAGGEKVEPVEAAVEAIRRAAQEKNVYVVSGAHTYRVSAKKNINWMFAIGPDGEELLCYEKLYDNHRAKMPGIFLIDGVPCNTAICADRWLRGVVEIPIQQGSQIFFELSNNYACEWVEPYGWYWSAPLARRNTIWSIFCNSANEAPGLISSGEHLKHGHSAIIAPDGQIVASTRSDAQEIVIAEIDVSHATRAMTLARGNHPALKAFWDAGHKLQQGESLESPPFKPLKSPAVDITLAAAPIAGDVEKMAAAIGQARAQGADMIVFPARAIDEKSLPKIQAAARDQQIGVAVGVQHGAPPTERNSAFVFGPDGTLLTRYDQLSATAPLQPGDNPKAMWFKLRGVPAVVTLEQDALWTELAELPAVAGAQVHIHLDRAVDDSRSGQHDRLQSWVTCASFLTFSATVSDRDARLWDDLHSREESRAEVKGTPRPDPGQIEVLSSFSANLIQTASAGQLITARRRVSTINPHHPARTANMNPQMKPWYELGAALIMPD